MNSEFQLNNIAHASFQKPAHIGDNVNRHISETDILDRPAYGISYVVHDWNVSMFNATLQVGAHQPVVQFCGALHCVLGLDVDGLSGVKFAIIAKLMPHYARQSIENF